MQGQVPGPNDGSVNRTACAVTNNADGVLDCCGREVTIQVQNCGSFVLYYLYSAPICPMAYCVGEQSVYVTSCGVLGWRVATVCRMLWRVVGS